MWGLARIAALGAALALAGCQTVANTLSQNDIAAMKLTGVTVSYAPDARVQWEDGTRAYAASKAISNDQVATITDTPEAKAYVQNLLAAKIKGSVESQMAGQLIGTRPVRLDIVVRSFYIPSAVQSVLIGGNRGMTATANLVDARTGAVIIAHPDLSVNMAAGGGVLGTVVQAAVDSALSQNVADQVVNLYGKNYREWLIRGA
ncbi:MAG: hypothetical protein V4517_21585 [Pseudomonadota bacterium]